MSSFSIESMSETSDLAVLKVTGSLTQSFGDDKTNISETTGVNHE